VARLRRGRSQRVRNRRSERGESAFSSGSTTTRKHGHVSRRSGRDLRALGWSEGRNVEIVARFGTADSERNRAAVAEIIALVPDVVVTSNPASVASMKAARTIPIVFTMQSDPVAAGFAESMARPGGNATGFAHFEQATVTKWLELLGRSRPA
jgi:putative ABC transport system substrate-binding protein